MRLHRLFTTMRVVLQLLILGHYRLQEYVSLAL